MTYCLGWLTRRGAYLVADAAVTSTEPPNTDFSSFGERHKEEAGVNVSEAALKIIATENSALTFSGDSQTGLSIAKTFQQELHTGCSVNTALERAITSNTPFRSGHTVCLMCAFYEDDSPRLISFNRSNDLKYINHAEGEVVQLGSISASGGISKLSESYVNKIHEMGLEGRLMLASVLALCQSFGVLNYLIEFGVGGTFSGGFVSSSGFHWQPDTGYLLFGTAEDGSIPQVGGVSTIVRENALSVRSALADGSPRVFMTNTKSESIHTMRERGHRVDAQNLELLRDHKFEYLAFLNNSLPIIVVIEMNRNLDHKSVVLNSNAIDAVGDQIPLSMSPNLQAILSGSPEILDSMRPKEDYSLGLLFHVEPYRHPHFDIDHVRFHVEFFNDNIKESAVPKETMDIYNSSKGTSEIFIQNQNKDNLSSAKLLGWYLENEGESLESFIPEECKTEKGSVFEVTFTINCTKNSLHMIIDNKEEAIKRLDLIVEYTWLPKDDSRPRPRNT